MHDTTSTAASIFAAKAAGAVIGSAISIAYVFPKGRREAAIRFCTGVAGGLVFGTTVGVKLAHELGIADVLSESETVLMGSAAASLAIWWVMGFLLQVTNVPSVGTKQIDRSLDEGKRNESS